VQMDYIPVAYSAETQQSWYHADNWGTGTLALNFGGGYMLENGRFGVQRFCVGSNNPPWPIFQARFQEGERVHVWMYYNSNEKYAEMKINGVSGRTDGNPDIINWTTAYPMIFDNGAVGCWNGNRVVQGSIENFTVTAGMAQSSYVSATDVASGTGDPHLRNIHGERFDLMKPGKHVLIHIPRGKSAESTLLRVQADARQMGGSCADMYFEALNVTGAWAEAKQAGGYHYSAFQSDAQTSQWVAFGKVELKIVIARTDKNVPYLNVYAKRLGQSGFPIGGLLGEDDHEDASTPADACVTRVSLKKDEERSFPGFSAGSLAVASLA